MPASVQKGNETFSTKILVKVRNHVATSYVRSMSVIVAAAPENCEGKGGRVGNA